jgi:hypothetical protein
MRGLTFVVNLGGFVSFDLILASVRILNDDVLAHLRALSRKGGGRDDNGGPTTHASLFGPIRLHFEPRSNVERRTSNLSNVEEAPTLSVKRSVIHIHIACSMFDFPQTSCNPYYITIFKDAMTSCILLLLIATITSTAAFVSAFLAPSISLKFRTSSSHEGKLQAAPRRLEENVPGPLYVNEKVRLHTLF